MKLGNCYEVHGKAISLGEVDGLLCHGTAYHPLTGWHGHCWIELNEDVVMDFSNGHHAVLRRERYYRAGKVKNVKRYTASEAGEMMLKTHSFGPWDKQLQSTCDKQQGLGKTKEVLRDLPLPIF